MDILFFVGLFLLGLFFGSFSNVVILRLHTGKSGIFTGRSECTSCNHELGFFDLFPLFSFLFLKGKCRYCKSPVSWQYPLVELFMGILFILFPFLFAISIYSFNLLFLFWVLVFTFFFVVLFIQDLLFFEVNRFISIPMIFLSMIGGYLFFDQNFINMIQGILIPSLFFGTQIFISRYIYTKKGEWVGEGDLDFGIILGVLLGPALTTLSLFLSYFIGSFFAIILMMIGKKEIPFGPFLLISLIISLFWGDEILGWYLSLIGWSNL